MRWISSPKSDLYMALHGGGPFRTSTYNTPDYKKYNPATEVIQTALKYVVPTWNPVGLIKNATEVTDKVVLELTSALAGKKSPKESIDRSADIVRSIVLGWVLFPIRFLEADGEQLLSSFGVRYEEAMAFGFSSANIDQSGAASPWTSRSVLKFF